VKQTETAVSVVVPTRNRPEPLRRCLTALASSRLPRERFEVIVVDDGSEQPMDPVVAGLEVSLDVRLLRQTAAGPATARNTGAAAAAAGRLLAFTDDDCEPAPDWLDHLLRAHREWPEAALGGPVANGLPRDLFSESSHILLQHIYDHFNTDPSDARFFATCNLAVSRHLFMQCGGFDRSYPFAAGEDRDFCRRWRATGRRLVSVPEAEVRHLHSLGPTGFWLQHFRYGRAARRIRRNSAQTPGGSFGFEQPAFYLEIFRAPFRRLPLNTAVQVAALLGVSQAAAAAGFARELVHPAPSAPGARAPLGASAKDRAAADPEAKESRPGSAR